MAVNLEELPLPDELPVIPEGWRYESLSDLVEERGLSYGIVQPGSETSDGVPIVRVNNIRNGRIDTTDMLKVTADIEAKFQRSRLRGGEVLLTLVGTLGEVAIVPDNLRGWNVARAVGVIPVRKDPGSLWVSICLRSAFIQHCIRTWATTTVQATFNLRDLAKLPIPIPPTATREAIAAVLGALDDKIELNRRMNATLEAMARALFQSWFVDFDPVRAKLDGRPPAALDPATAALFPDSFQDSPLGHIPKGWVIRPLAEAFDIKDGATFKKEDRLERGSIIAFGANGPVGFSTRANVTEPCIALGKIGSCGSLHRSWDTCWITNNAFVVKPHRGGSLEFMWRTLCTIDFTQFIGGSANPYMPLKNFGHTPVVMPPAPLLNAYQERAGSLAAKIVANDEQSRTLATLRDTLLPKLLSGELSVS